LAPFLISFRQQIGKETIRGMGQLSKNECFSCIVNVLEVIVIHIAKKARFA